MKVWAKVGVNDIIEIEVEGDEPRNIGLMKAIKSVMPNTFRTTDYVKIVIIDPNTEAKFASTEFSTSTSRGSTELPFIVEAPEQGIVGNAYPFLHVITSHLFSIPYFIPQTISQW